MSISFSSSGVESSGLEYAVTTGAWVVVRWVFESLWLEIVDVTAEVVVVWVNTVIVASKAIMFEPIKV